MKRTLIFLLLALLTMGFLIIGCVPGPTPEPQNPAEIAMTMAGQKMDAEATQMRINIIYTATAQVIEATRSVEGTQAAIAVTEQFRQDAAATDQQFRRDAASTEQRKQDDAAATAQRKREDAATEQARRDVEATAEQGRQNVIGTATAQQAAIWNGMTQMAAPTHDLLTLQAAHVEQTLAVNKLELSNLEVEQQTQTNTLEWLIPFLISMAVTALVSVYVIRRSRVREIRNDETGEIDVLVLDNEEVIRPRMLPGPLLDLRGKTPTIPLLVDAETQNEVTRRAQLIDALRAMPATAPTAQATMMTNSVFGETKKPVIELLQPGQASRAILNELSDQVVEEE